jgi:hypothetical protein
MVLPAADPGRQQLLEVGGGSGAIAIRGPAHRLGSWQLVQAPAGPARGWLLRCDRQQDPPLGCQGTQMLIVV